MQRDSLWTDCVIIFCNTVEFETKHMWFNLTIMKRNIFICQWVIIRVQFAKRCKCQHCCLAWKNQLALEKQNYKYQEMAQVFVLSNVTQVPLIAQINHHLGKWFLCKWPLLINNIICAIILFTDCHWHVNISCFYYIITFKMQMFHNLLRVIKTYDMLS